MNLVGDEVVCGRTGRDRAVVLDVLRPGEEARVGVDLTLFGGSVLREN